MPGALSISTYLRALIAAAQELRYARALINDASIYIAKLRRAIDARASLRRAAGSWRLAMRSS